MDILATPSAEFTDTCGDKLAIVGLVQGAFLVRISPGPNAQPDLSGVVLNASEAPAVALAILTAAGFVPRGNRRDSDSFQESVDTAAGYLDDAVHLATGAAAAKELTRRKDVLARELVPHIPGITYGTLATAGIKRAIDMIIQLQDEATK